MGRDEEVTGGEWLVVGLRRRGGYWPVTGLYWVFLLSTIWFLPATRYSLHVPPVLLARLLLRA